MKLRYVGSIILKDYIVIKMKNHLLPTTLLGATALVGYVTPAAALSPVEVQRIAKQRTVQIEGCNKGSGVIIQKNGNNYTVLTAAHVVSDSGCEVIAPDDTSYRVTKVNIFPNQIDLAVVNFTSNKNYPVAKTIRNSDRIEAGETIYVSGFPVSTAIAKSVFAFVKGDVVSNGTKQQEKGYSLIYNNSTLPGYSGGPVWSDQGELIAIHGQGDIDTKLRDTVNADVRIKTGFNLGITVNTFTKLASTAGINGYEPVAIAAKPKPIDDLIASAVQKERQGNYRGVLVDMDRAITLDAKNSRPYYGRGLAKAQLGDNKGAIADYNRAIALNPNFTNAYHNRGFSKSEIGDEKGAIKDYNRAITLNPNDDQAYNNRASAKSEVGDKKGAINDWNRAININPNFAFAYHNRAIVEARLGNLKKAQNDWNRALQINPQLAPAYRNRGNIKSLFGDARGAIQDYNRAIFLNPNDAQAFYNRAHTESGLGNKKKAVEDYNRAINLYPNDFQSYYNRGITKFELGNRQAAIEDYTRAIAINPGFSYAYHNRGTVKSALGDKAGALLDWRKAAEIFNQQGQVANYRKSMSAIERLGS